MLAAAGVVALVLGLSACAAESTVDIDVPQALDAPLGEETQQQLQAALEQAMTASGASGALVSVIVPWSGTWTAALGTSTPGGADVSTDMRFPVANVTRAMTCDVLYAVAAEGTVSLTDPVTTWVNGMPGYENVTLQQLCDSTSGIASYQAFVQPRWFVTPQRVWNPRELAAYGLGAPATGEPGAAYRDSDTGYILLGVALERATGKSAADLYAQYVTGPLQLSATTLPAATTDRATSSNALHGLHSTVDAEGVMNCTEPTDITSLSSSAGFTAAGVVADIGDLARYTQALASLSLPYDTEARFADPYAAYNGAPAWYTAKGGALQAGSLVGQYGSMPGYITAAFADPETGMTVAVVLNNSGATAGMGASLAWELAAIASKAPAVSGKTAPDAGLPWTAEQYADQIAGAAICAAPAE